MWGSVEEASGRYWTNGLIDGDRPLSCVHKTLFPFRRMTDYAIMRRMDGRLRAAPLVCSFRRSPAVLSTASSYPIRIFTPQPLHVNEEVPRGRLKQIAAFRFRSTAQFQFNSHSSDYDAIDIPRRYLEIPFWRFFSSNRIHEE